MRLASPFKKLPHRIPCFDEVVSRFSAAHISFSEVEALKASHWDEGEDARLREDIRFRPTPWGRFVLSQSFLANDALYVLLIDERKSEINLDDTLSELSTMVGRKCVFCSSDDRFVLANGELRLAPKELTGRPLIELTITDFEKFNTHLPVHSLRAAAASAPAGEWGPGMQEQLIETLGWLRVSIAGRRKLNERMFVAKIVGHSMDDGQSGLVNGGLAVFELWPSGSRQLMNVLVRASFSDPETGSYAVKKYVGDSRDVEGIHHEIRLVSLNPDKERFPDIVLNETDDITVIAKVIQSLSLDEFAREPRKHQRSGLRNLSDPTEVEKHEMNLRRLYNRFFNALACELDERSSGKARDWKSRLVCLETEAGGLCIETQALSWLPPFAKTLRITAGGCDSIVVLASNLRGRTWRTSVPPSTEPYTWSAPGREEILEDELRPYKLAGLSSGRCLLFQVDAAGVGQPMIGNTISFPAHYRLIVPPELTMDLSLGEVSVLSGGWRLCEVTLPDNPGDELRKKLNDLGYNFGQEAPIGKWALGSALFYEETAREELFPVFSTNQSPIISIGGVTCIRQDELILLVTGEKSSESISLPPGSSWIVEINGIEPGRYMLQVLHERTEFSPLTLPFCVSGEDGEYVSAELTIQFEGKEIFPTLQNEFLLETDLSNADKQKSLHIMAPPCWPFNIYWDDGNSRKLSRIYASTSGQIDLDKLSGQLDELVKRASLSLLTIDGAELGIVKIRHSRRFLSLQLKSKTQLLLNDRGRNLKAIDGQFPLLRNLWLHPMLELLGYTWKEADDADLQSAPSGVTALKLNMKIFDDFGNVRDNLRWALVITSPSIEWDSETGASIRQFADSLCKHWKLNESIFTDGIRWSKHQQYSKLRMKILNVIEAATSNEVSIFSDFVREFVNPTTVED